MKWWFIRPSITLCYCYFRQMFDFRSQTHPPILKNTRWLKLDLCLFIRVLLYNRCHICRNWFVVLLTLFDLTLLTVKYRSTTTTLDGCFILYQITLFFHYISKVTILTFFYVLYNIHSDYGRVSFENNFSRSQSIRKFKISETYSLTYNMWLYRVRDCMKIIGLEREVESYISLFPPLCYYRIGPSIGQPWL